MSGTDPIDVVRGVYAAMDAADPAALGRLVAPGLVVEQSPDVPWGGRHVGPAAAAFGATVAAHLHSKIEHLDLFRAGDRVVQVGRTRGHAVRTGRAFDAAEVHVWSVVDGLVTSLQVYADTVALRAALGLDDPTTDP